ncbi:hypothetical protein [Spirosoma endophyticum]|uniref:Uncharacterized protein n=1 Tax=Spirosoma endophyticum TaxID=662367 RepID=A0A1I1SMX2_9BACT|nr:hypothetical protein [Spirosoma endophyticum]SFD47807.1 hypothetical protein SAMN05216167_105167 [Spirosoma endophyticum]
MNNNQLQRGNEIQAEKEQIKKFAKGVAETIVNRAQAQLSQELRTRILADGLAAAMGDLVDGWERRETEKLEAEFAAL